MTMRQGRGKRRTRQEGRSRPARFSTYVIGVGGLLASVASTTALMRGPASGTGLQSFLDAFAGVFTLLTMTGTMICGLAAADRTRLSATQRIALQAVHRAASVSTIGFLVVHVGVKVAEQDTTWLAALLPFGGGVTFAVSLGALAADLLVLSAATGAARARFAGSARPGAWRALHGAAYACWPLALVHGLTAGRRAAAWVAWGYGLCGAIIALTLIVRGLGYLDRRSTWRGAALRARPPGEPSPVGVARLAALSRPASRTPSPQPVQTKPAFATGITTGLEPDGTVAADTPSRGRVRLSQLRSGLSAVRVTAAARDQADSAVGAVGASPEPQLSAHRSSTNGDAQFSNGAAR